MPDHRLGRSDSTMCSEVVFEAQPADARLDSDVPLDPDIEMPPSTRPGTSKKVSERDHGTL